MSSIIVRLLRFWNFHFKAIRFFFHISLQLTKKKNLQRIAPKKKKKKKKYSGRLRSLLAMLHTALMSSSCWRADFRPSPTMDMTEWAHDRSESLPPRHRDERRRLNTHTHIYINTRSSRTCHQQHELFLFRIFDKLERWRRAWSGRRKRRRGRGSSFWNTKEGNHQGKL